MAIDPDLHSAEGERRDFLIHTNIYDDKNNFKMFTSIPKLQGDDRYRDDGSAFGDNVNLYNLNSRAFRSPEFDGTADLVTIGCSQTFGVGVPQEHGWPSRLSEMTGMSLANLGMPGTGAQDGFNKLLAYVEEYGKPKAVAVLYTDYRRMNAGLRYDSNTSNSSLNHESSGVGIGLIRIDPRSGKDIASYSKKPYNLDNILALEFTMYQTMLSIDYMTLYCKEAGIKLAYSSWEPQMQELLTLKYNYNTATVGMDSFIQWDNFLHNLEKENPTCHEDKSNLYGETWHRGDDIYSPHIGIHQHLHYAELFAEKLKNI